MATSAEALPDELTLERIRHFVADAELDDPVLAQAWARLARDQLLELVRTCELLLRRDGGRLGRELLKVLEPAILKEANRTVQLQRVKDLGLTVHMLDDAVIVDLRLTVGAVPA